MGSVESFFAFASSSYFGMGRNSWNSIAASTTMATTVQTLNDTSPVISPPNWKNMSPTHQANTVM